MAANRFDFEQQIMKCWTTADDIELIYKRVSDNDLRGDELINTLLGLSNLHTLRSQELFDMFEELIKNGTIE